MEYKLWIYGQWTETKGGGRMAVENPATGKKVAEVVAASRVDVDIAVQTARAAFHDGRWSKKTPAERSKILWNLADLMEAQSEVFARVESENTGKPYRFATLGGDMPFIVDNMRY